MNSVDMVGIDGWVEGGGEGEGLVGYVSSSEGRLRQ